MNRIIAILFCIACTQTVLAQVEKQSDTLIILKGVEIRGSDERLPYQMEVVRQEAIEAEPAKDVGNLLRTLPNVSGIRKGGIGIDPVVRGFKYSQINTQINNGIKIEGGCPNRMDPAVSHIDADDIKKLEVIKGPFALRYGPVLGSVVNIQTLKPMPNNVFEIHVKGLFGYESNWNGTKQQLSVFGGNKAIFFSLSGNYKKYGNYTAGNDMTVKSAFTRYNWSANLGISPAKGHQILFSYDDSHGRDVLFPALPMDERKDDTRLMSVDYTIDKISETFRDFSVKLYHSNVNHEMDNKDRPFSDTVVAVSTIQAITSGYRIETLMNFGEDNIWIGSDYEDIFKDGDRIKTRILEPTMPVMGEKLWNDARINNLGFFMQYDRKFNHFDFVFAARFDFNTGTSGDLLLKREENVLYSNTDVESQHANFSLSASGTYHFDEQWSFGLSLGRGVRSPDMVERYIILLPIGYDPYDYLGNPKLDPEANNEMDLMGRFSDVRIGAFDAVVFFSYVQNYILGRYVPPSEVKPQTKGVLGVKQFYNEDYVFLTGFEFAYLSPAKYKWGLKASLAYTAGVNPNTERLIIEDGQVVDKEEIMNDPIPEIPPLAGTLVFNYKFLSAKLVPEIGLRFVAAQKRVSMAYNESETPGFMTMDIR
ncbi:MAG: TonB-dependent receptor, partial [Bacteroidota bacterium]|nr:TonB-dependent receptor [Bacteroidota bacterium]